jgi:hypothetical protein
MIDSLLSSQTYRGLTSSYQVAFEGALRRRRGADAGVRKYVEERDEETTKVRRRRQLGISLRKDLKYGIKHHRLIRRCAVFVLFLEFLQRRVWR